MDVLRKYFGSLDYECMSDSTIDWMIDQVVKGVQQDQIDSLKLRCDLDGLSESEIDLLVDERVREYRQEEERQNEMLAAKQQNLHQCDSGVTLKDEDIIDEKQEMYDYHILKMMSHKDVDLRSRLEAETFKEINNLLQTKRCYKDDIVSCIDLATLERRASPTMNELRRFCSVGEPWVQTLFNSSNDICPFPSKPAEESTSDMPSALVRYPTVGDLSEEETVVDDSQRARRKDFLLKKWRKFVKSAKKLFICGKSEAE